MTPAERGIFIDLLAFSWLNRGLPDDLDSLSRMVNQPLEAFKMMWDKVSKSFYRKDGKLWNKRLEQERKKQKDFSVKMSGLAEKRWRTSSVPSHSKTRNAHAMPALQCSSSSSSSSLTTTPIIPTDLEADKADIETWLAYKREKGQTYKPRGLEALWDMLRKIPAGQRKASIENSMASNYQGIFPPKKQGGFGIGKTESAVGKTGGFVPTKQPLF